MNPRRHALIGLAVALWLGATAQDRFAAWIAATPMPTLIAETSDTVTDRNGALLRVFPVEDGRWRLTSTRAGADPLYLQMLLAYEDRRFDTHSGVDPLALIRATGQAALSGRVVSGGSTLTMQTARLIENGPTGDWHGKLRQARLALALERRLDKDQILSLYLTHAPFGGNVEGLRAASLTWFGKEPTRLTPAQAALLVALPQSPETRRPDRHTEAARAARARVLRRAHDAGLIDDGDLAAALREALPTTRRAFPALAPHLADRVRRESPDQGQYRLTIDADLQAALEPLARRAAREAGAQMSIAMVVADHTTGEVLAHIGSSAYAPGQPGGFVDMTAALRSPGSTLKPLVYGLAFDQGLAHPESLIDDLPVAFDGYAPQNFDGEYRGTILVRDALRLSLNIPVVSLTDALGPPRLLAHLRRAGTDPVLPGNAAPGLAIALGGLGISAEDLTRLYAGLAQGGRPVDLRWTPRPTAPADTPFLSPEAAWLVSDILGEMLPPTGAPDIGLAYKTGTSYGHRDAWAIGFDGRHVITVWMGRADGTPVPGAFGGELAAPILFQAFARLKPQLDPLPPPPPATLLVAHADLPAPLQHFRPRGAAFAVAEDTPDLSFPPTGARMITPPEGLTVKVRQGQPPFTWMANGAPVLIGAHSREAILPLTGKGLVTLSVIDSAGRADRTSIWLD